MAGEIKTIELLSLHYQAQCRAKNCTARATVIARASDAIGRPKDQYELCAPHAEQIAERERAKGRKIFRHE
jgi:hypothetical protein